MDTMTRSVPASSEHLKGSSSEKSQTKRKVHQCAQRADAIRFALNEPLRLKNSCSSCICNCSCALNPLSNLELSTSNFHRYPSSMGGGTAPESEDGANSNSTFTSIKRLTMSDGSSRSQTLTLRLGGASSGSLPESEAVSGNVTSLMKE